MPALPTAADIQAAVADVAARDPVMATHIARCGPFQPRPGHGDYFKALARSIVFQQLAGRAAATIHGRFEQAVGGDVSAEAVLATPLDALRAAGLSGAKAASVIDLATKAVEGVVPLEGIDTYDDEEIITRLSTVRGIGRWTAEMFLLFELGRLDVWPVGDLAVRAGWKLIYDLAAAPTPKELDAMGERFRPFRTIPAWYSWQAVHLARGEMIVPDAT